MRLAFPAFLAAVVATVCPSAHAALVPAFDYGYFQVSLTSSTYTKGGLIVSGGDLRQGSGLYESGAAKFLLGLGPVTSAVLSFDVEITQGTAGFTGNIPLLISGFASDNSAITSADFIASVTTGPTVTLPSTLGNDGIIQHIDSVDVTSLVKSLAAAGTGTIELRFSDATSGSNVIIGPTFESTGAYLPMLAISFAAVPEPASALLMILALASLRFATRANSRSYPQNRASNQI